MGESEWETVMHFPGPLVLGLVGVVWEYWGFVLIFLVFCFAFHLGGHRIRTVRKKSSCCLRLWHSAVTFLFVFSEMQAGPETTSGFDFCFHILSIKIYWRDGTPHQWFQYTGSGS